MSEEQGFDFELHRNEKAHRTGTGLYLKALRKYHIEPTLPIHANEHNKIVFQAKASGTGRVPATNVGADVEWLGRIYVGTPPQKLDVGESA